MRRVAIVGPSWSSLARLRGDFITHVLGLHHQVMCLAPDDTGDPVREHASRLEKMGAICMSYPLRAEGLHTLADRKSISVLKAKFSDWKPHVALGYQLKPMLLAAIAAKRAEVPRIVSLVADLGDALGGLDEPGWRWRRLTRGALSASHATVFHNRSDRQRLERLKLLSDAADTAVIPGAGVDLQRFAVLPMPSVLGGLTFVMIAPFRREKGVIEFCKAAQMVRKQWPDARFILSGPDGMGADKIAVPELAAFEGDVTFRGDHRDVRPLFDDAHVVVLPSWREGMSRTLQEALASGRPIIATDVPGCRETVDERVNGILVPPRDADALAAAMCSMIDRPELLRSMGRASRLKAERLFDVREINRALSDVLGLG